MEYLPNRIVNQIQNFQNFAFQTVRQQILLIVKIPQFRQHLMAPLQALILLKNHQLKQRYFFNFEKPWLTELKFLY